MDKLNEEQQEMLNLLRSMGMAYFFDMFDGKLLFPALFSNHKT